MVDISILDWEAAKQKGLRYLRKAALVGIVSGMIGSAATGIGLFVDFANKALNKTEIQQNIRFGNLDHAAEQLKNCSLYESDRAELSEMFEKVKAKSDLEAVIAKYDFAEASQLLKEVEAKHPDIAQEYLTAVEELQPEIAYKKFQNSFGIEKVNYAKKINILFERGEKFPFEDIDAFLFEAYFSSLNYNFECRTESSSTNTMLKEFYDFISSHDIAGYAEGLDADAFYSAGLGYISSIPKDSEVHIGDKVRAVRALGHLKGNPEVYYGTVGRMDTKVKDCPIGTELIVFGVSDDREEFNVGKNWEEWCNRKRISLIRNEFEKIDDYSEIKKNLDVVYRLLKNAGQTSEKAGD